MIRKPARRLDMDADADRTGVVHHCFQNGRRLVMRPHGARLQHWVTVSVEAQPPRLHRQHESAGRRHTPPVPTSRK